MTSYEQTVRGIAEEMAKEGHKDIWDEDGFPIDWMLEDFLPAARIAVKNISDEIRKCWAYYGSYKPDNCVDIEEYLSSLGLIPSPENKEQ